jgi:hypothetical protein
MINFFKFILVALTVALDDHAQMVDADGQCFAQIYGQPAMFVRHFYAPQTPFASAREHINKHILLGQNHQVHGPVAETGVHNLLIPIHHNEVIGPMVGCQVGHLGNGKERIKMLKDKNNVATLKRVLRRFQTVSGIWNWSGG